MTKINFDKILFRCIMLNGSNFNNNKFISLNQILYNITIDNELPQSGVPALEYHLYQFDTCIYFYFRKGDIFYYSFIYESNEEYIKQIYNQFIKQLLKDDIEF